MLYVIHYVGFCYFLIFVARLGESNPWGASSAEEYHKKVFLADSYILINMLRGIVSDIVKVHNPKGRINVSVVLFENTAWKRRAVEKKHIYIGRKNHFHITKYLFDLKRNFPSACIKHFHEQKLTVTWYSQYWPPCEI